LQQKFTKKLKNSNVLETTHRKNKKNSQFAIAAAQKVIQMIIGQKE